MRRGTDLLFGDSQQPGESLGHFNKFALVSHRLFSGLCANGFCYHRRIEADFRPSVRAAVKSSTAAAAHKRVQKNIEELTDEPEPDQPSGKQTKPKNPAKNPSSTEGGTTPGYLKRAERKTEFDTLPARTSLRDVALAPPTLTRATKKAPPRSTHGTVTSSLSMAQKAALEQEREKAIQRYRELKETRKLTSESAPRDAGALTRKESKGKLKSDPSATADS